MAILSTSCSSDFPQEPLAHTYESRSVTPGTESETNPTLLADWENCDYIIVNDHSSQRVPPPGVLAPAEASRQISKLISKKTMVG